MFTYNGLKKIQCSFEESTIVIDGEQFEIKCKKEITAEKSKLFTAPVVLGVASILLGGMGAKELIAGDRFGALFLLAPSFIIIPVAFSLAMYAINQSRCRSLWRLNFFHPLCIEKSDDITIENRLLNLAVPDESTLTKPVNQFITKTDSLILVVLTIIFLLCCKDVLPGWTGLLLPGYALWLRIRDIIWDLNNQKWQRPTPG